jgi:uncharacterized protein YebE (UPF0316 family)
MSTETTLAPSIFSTLVSTGKDLTALLRDFVLIIVFIALLLFPQTFNDIMIKAGFEEGSIVGMKWKKGITKSDIALKEAQATISAQAKQLDSTSKLLAEAKKQIDNPELKKKITDMQTKSTELKKETNLTQLSVNKTISSNAILVENAQKAVNDNSSWGVILAGDSSLKDAQSEVGVMNRKYGVPNAVIYFRQGSYRSVAIVNNRSEAEDILIKAKKRRPDAYIVPMATWCKNSVQKDGYLDCTGK